MGGSARIRDGRPDPAVLAAGPPPAPVLAAPWEARPVRSTGTELVRVVGWMHQPHVAATWGQDWDVPAWSAEIGRQLAGHHSRPWTVWRGGRALAYVEIYRVARDVIADAITTDAHDLGIHLAIGEPELTGRGVGRTVLDVLAEGLFAADPRCRRVVGDPAAGHEAARRAFVAAGFTAVAEVDLPHKRAALLARPRPPTSPRERDMSTENQTEILAAIQRSFDVVMGERTRTLTLDDQITADLGFDSLDFIDLVSELGGELPADAIDTVLDEVSDLRTVGDIVDRFVALGVTRVG